MTNYRRTFLGGKMNRDLDERVIPEGEYRHAENIEIANSEGSDVGSVQNSFSNKKMTSLSLGSFPNTLGKYECEARDKLYWFVKSNSGCYLLEWDNNSQSVSYVLKDTRVGAARVLNLSDTHLITGIDKIVNDNLEDDILLWTDNNMEICSINIERAKKYGVNGFDIEDITLIKKPPRFAPKATLIYNGREGNNIEEKFLLFAYRYQYLDNEWSALSSFTNYQFRPKPYNMDYYTLDNLGMVNSRNAVNIEFNVGDKRVKAVQIIFKESNSNVLSIIETFDKAKEGWADNSLQNLQFSNNKNYRALPSTELGRTFDNVPRKAKALTLINNRLVVGNYQEGYNIADANGKKIKLDYNVSLKSIPLNNNNSFITAMTQIDGSNTATISNYTDPTLTLLLKKGYLITFNFTIVKTAPSLNTLVYEASFDYPLDKDFANLQELFLYPAFVSFSNVIINDFALTYQDHLAPGETVVTPPALSIFTTGLNAVGFSVTPLIHTTDPVTVDVSQSLFFQSSTYVSIISTSSSASCKSNRDYEVGLEYYDTVSRETVTLTCPNNSIYIPNEMSEYKNTLSVEINNLPPYFADRFKLVVKTPMLSYYTIIVNNFYIEGAFVWIKLEGSNLDKVHVGEYLILKSALGDIKNTIIKTKILEIGQKTKDFIATTDIEEPEGTYMKIRPNEFAMKQADNLLYPDFKSYSSTNKDQFPIAYLDLNTVLNTLTGLNEKQKLTPGNEIKFKFLSKFNYKKGWSNKLFEQTYRILRNYNNVEEWFNEIIDGNSLKGEEDCDYNGNVSIVVGYVETIQAVRSAFDVFTPDPAGKEYLKVVGLEDGTASGFTVDIKSGYLDALVEIRITTGDYIFETEPKKDITQNLFYKTEQTFEVIGGNHQGNVQNQNGAAVPCIIDLDYFNCFAQGNGVESYQVKDAFNKPYLNIDTRPTSTITEEYKEVRRLSDLTYAETYVESTNRNGLNEFNQSRGNFKELDKSFGEITKLVSRDNELVVFQSEKASQVLYEKDEISSSDGKATLVAVDYVLGRQIPYMGQNGCQNPESVAVQDRQIYYANTGNGIFQRLSTDGVDTIVKGMTSYFRNLFIERPNAKVLGGIDPYFGKYVVSVGDEPITILELQCGNIISKHAIGVAFTYHFKINELSGNIVLDYDITEGNATIEALFDGEVTVVSNVTGTGSLVIPRTTLDENIVAVTVTPVGENASYEIANNCPEGVPLKIVSIVLGDALDDTKSITNRFKWGVTPYYETLDTFLATPLTRFSEETGVEGQGKFPLRGSTVNIQSYSKVGQLGEFSIANDNRLGYLISPTVYTSADVATILGLSTFPTVTESIENITNVVNQASFAFAKTTDAQILYLIWDYTDRNITLEDDSFTVDNAGAYIANVLSNDTITGTPVVTIVTPPANGTAVVNLDNTITYTHDGTTTLTDSYVYQVTNGISTGTATVSIIINAVGTVGYCSVWEAHNNSNISMSIDGYIDFTTALAGRSINTGSGVSVGTITQYRINGSIVPCSIPMTFTSNQAIIHNEHLPVVLDKVLTSISFYIEIICTNGSEIFVSGENNAIDTPGAMDSSYDDCTI
ncbi:MAG: Ig-like domain-containing protein [Flavobacterium sp.]|nr:Ig-like domain-containing protein [Flavobacterium sp.]